jgi:hypothetical protein
MLDEGIRRIAQIDTTAGLQIELETLSKAIGTAQPDESLNLQKLVITVQSRIIELDKGKTELDRRRNRTATLLALLAIVLALLFGVLSIWFWLYPKT